MFDSFKRHLTNENVLAALFLVVLGGGMVVATTVDTRPFTTGSWPGASAYRTGTSDLTHPTSVRSTQPADSARRRTPTDTTRTDPATTEAAGPTGAERPLAGERAGRRGSRAVSGVLRPEVAAPPLTSVFCWISPISQGSPGQPQAFGLSTCADVLAVLGRP